METCVSYHSVADHKWKWSDGIEYTRRDIDFISIVNQTAAESRSLDSCFLLADNMATLEIANCTESHGYICEHIQGKLYQAHKYTFTCFSDFLCLELRLEPTYFQEDNRQYHHHHHTTITTAPPSSYATTTTTRFISISITISITIPTIIIIITIIRILHGQLCPRHHQIFQMG